MFWQSVWGLFDLYPTYGDYYILVNTNALDNCYMVLSEPEAGPSPFPAKIDITVSSNSEQSINALPVFDAEINGIEGATPWFLMDFSNSDTVIWGADCV
jgi:hypothetical protein